MTNEELFLEARREHGDKVRAVVAKLIPAEDRKDLEQTIWLSVWVALRKFGGRSSVGTYIFPIARRRIADYFRGRYRWMKLLAKIKSEFDAAPPESPISPKESADTQEALPAVRPEELSTILLTPTEIGVLRLIADVMPNGEIARTLSVSLNTVRTHVKQIYRKTKISNRGNLILFAREFWKKEES